MEASSFSDSIARPKSVEIVSARAAEPRNVDWPLAVMILGSAVVLYAAIGVALYMLIALAV
jgi:hypothetical protein